MPSSPDIAGFTPTGISDNFGVETFHYQGGEGQRGLRLDLSEFGVQRLDDPTFHDLLAESIHAVARAPRQIPIFDRGTVLKEADPKGKYRTMSSVYDMGSFIVKAGLDIHEGPIQFGAMNWLHASLPQVTERVAAPAQYALITSSHDLPTTLMERASGTPLQFAAHPMVSQIPGEVAAAARAESVRTVKTALVEAIGRNACAVLMNDIGQHGHVENILVNGTPGTESATYMVIDQPSVTSRKDRLLLPLAYNRLLKEQASSKTA
jgi:hypothetical protein